MIIEVWWIGKTQDKVLEKGIAEYQKRIQRLNNMRWVTLPDLKKASTMSPDQRKEKEGELILGKLNDDDLLVILDERGKEFTSVNWAKWLEKKMASPGKRMVFLIGGTFGFSEPVFERAGFSIALSQMTLTHEMTRLVLAEQFYRAFTIINNIKYHY